MTTILVPRASGVLAALGLVVSPRRRDVVRSVLTTSLDVGPIVEELSERADFGEGVRVVCELRYRGQAYELAVEGQDDLRARFEAEHERAYGYRDPDAEVELVTVRVSGTTGRVQLVAETGTERTRYEGPELVRLPESTLVIAEGWCGATEAGGTIRLWTP